MVNQTAVLKETFIKLTTIFSTDIDLIHNLWVEIELNYSNKKRHYHTLQHLENLLEQLNEVKDNIKNWETILFTLYYHDIIYNALKSDNEEKSAVLAEKRMKEINVPLQMIEHCKKQIFATKNHKDTDDEDTNYFLDVDLSILGQSYENYKTYYQNLRKEYSIYPDMIYNAGRKKVLKHFLTMDRIFKTEYFYNKFEKQARQNLELELEGY